MEARVVGGKIVLRGIPDAALARMTDQELQAEMSRVWKERRAVRGLAMGQPRWYRAELRKEDRVLASEERRIEREQARRRAQPVGGAQ